MKLPGGVAVWTRIGLLVALIVVLVTFQRRCGTETAKLMQALDYAPDGGADGQAP